MASTSTMEVEASPQTNEKDAEIVKLLTLVDIIISKLGEAKESSIKNQLLEGVINLEISNEVAEVLLTLFTCLRKEEHGVQGFERYKEYTAKIDGVDIPIHSLVEEVKSKRVFLNFLIATPIVELMTLFKAFFNEVRTGVGRFKVRTSVANKAIQRDAQGMARRSDQNEATQSIAEYELGTHHVPLLQGISLAPKRRTGIIRSLGPLAQAILLVMEDQYHSELTEAMLNSLQMLPMAQEIINCLKEARTPATVSWILKELGDILLLTTTLANQKIYMPLYMIIYMWKNKPQDVEWSFSVASMLNLYTALCLRKRMKFTMKSGADKFKTAEVVFHAMFGTYLEDLSILSQITSHTGRWRQRKELNEVFHKRSCQEMIEVPFISFKYIKKMAQSHLTKSVRNLGPVATRRLSLSGYRKLAFDLWTIRTISNGDDTLHLLCALRKTKKALIKENDSIKMLQAGTKEWEELKDGVWSASNFVPVERWVKFYG